MPELARLIEISSIFHGKSLRYIQHLPTSTAIPALHLLLGVPPVEAQLHIRTLTFFRSAVAAEANSPPAIFMMQELLLRQLATKDAESTSWINHIKYLLRLYNLPSAYQLANHTPTKAAWKNSTGSSIRPVKC